MAQRPLPSQTIEKPLPFVPLACGIALVAVLLRLLFLGAAVFHPDEAIHAHYSWNFLAYRYDPVYHGPLLYHLVALVLHSPLGDSDATARLVPALMGTGVVLLTLFSARRWIGEKPALAAALILAISPVMTAYSRRLIHDSLVWMLTFGLVLYFQQARETRSNSWEGREARIGVAILLACFLATKANSFFIIAMLLSFWLCTVLRSQSTVELEGTSWLPVSLFGVVGVASVFAIRGGEAEKTNELMLAATAVICCALLWEWLRRAPREETAKDANASFDWLSPVLAFGAGLFIFVFLYGRGYTWLREGFTNEKFVEVCEAMPRMIDYWRGQQGKPRLAGPHDYHIVLALIYELPIVVAGVGGIVRASRVRTPFTDLLLWWCFTSFALYAIANEKVPWLLSHQLLPLALLGGVWLGTLKWREVQIPLALAGAVFLVRGVVATSFARPGDRQEPLFYAQTGDAFGDAFRKALDESVWKNAKPPTTPAPPAKGLWLQSDRQWPPAWYVRHTVARANVVPSYEKHPAVGLPGEFDGVMAVMPLDGTAESPGWNQLHREKFPGWRTWSATGKNAPGVVTTTEFLLWPRASWPALRPDRFARWWLTREATKENGVLSEWNSTPAVVATKK
ncbi:MAG TPA: flippase activity-associated protein Agl23 [Abditibacteriaceae bacterium]|jgi:uncharacterized protein (TIGR03663 family)